MTMPTTLPFQNPEEEATYRAEQAIPTQASVPRVQAATFGWGGGSANRSLSHNGGSVSTMGYLGSRYGPTTFAAGDVQAAQDAGKLPDSAIADVGKFSLSVAPQQTYTPLDTSKEPPVRMGDFEGMFGGLTKFLVGFLSPAEQETVAALPAMLGRVIDAPLGLLSHDIPGFGVEESFNRMVETPEKADMRRAAAANPTMAHWYMTEYINTHTNDFAEAHGMPHVLAQMMLPGRNPIGRIFGAMNAPAEAAQRMIAGGALDWLPGVEMDRVTELLNTPNDELHPLLLEIKEQYQRGDFDEDGLLDRMTSAGFGLSNDAFTGMLLSFVTDPLILASMGTGLAARMVTKGGLMHRASQVSAAVWKLPEGSPLRALMEQAQARAFLKPNERRWGVSANRDTAYRAVEHFIDMRKGNDEIDQLVRGVESALPRHQRFQVAIERVARPANAISEVINSPFGIFGENGAARSVLKKYTADSSDGFWRAHGYETAVKMTTGLSDMNGVIEAGGYAHANRVRALAAQSLVKQLRVQGKGDNPLNLPDAVNVDNYVKAFEEMENPLSAREMESFVRGTRKLYTPELDPDLLPAEKERQLGLWRDEMNERAIQKFAYAARTTVEEARQRVGDGGHDVWSLVDELHYGRLIKELGEIRANEVGRTATEMDALVGANKKALAAAKQEEVARMRRATFVGERELTENRAAEALVLVRQALKTGSPADISAAISLVSRYDQLRGNFFEQTKNADDTQMLRWMERYLDGGIKDETFVKTITDRDELDSPALWKLLDDTNARSGDTAWELGLGPAPDKLFKEVLDEEGHVIGYRVWMDIASDASSVSAPTNMRLARYRLFSAIRAEHILQENQRRFSIFGTERFGLTAAEAAAVWSALRRQGIKSSRTLRSFQHSELDGIIQDAAITDSAKTKLGAMGLARLTAMAMEGDIRMSGAIPKLTGRFKTATAGQVNNNIGHTAEHIYPMLRFSLSPFFLMQEYVEPFFWNILRGVKVGLRESSEESAFRDVVVKFGGDELFAQDAIAREVRTIGVLAAREAVNPSTALGREIGGAIGRLTSRSPLSGVMNTKRINYMNLTMERFGALARQAIDAMETAARQRGSSEMNGAWSKIANEMQRIVDEGGISYKDPKTGVMVPFAKKNLTDGEVARMYFEQNGITQRSRTWQTQLWDGQNPSSLGRVSAIRQSNLAGLLGRNSGVDLRNDIANGVITEWEFRGKLARLGFDGDYTRRAWDMMTGPTKDEFLDSVEQAYRNFKPPSQAKLARDLLEADLMTFAVHHGITPEEAVSRRYAKTSQFLATNGVLPSNAHAQSVARIITDNGGSIADEAAGSAFRQVDEALTGEVITGTEMVGPAEWRVQALDELDEDTLRAVANFDQDLGRLVASVITDPDDALDVFDVVRNDPQLGFSLLANLVSNGGDLQAMLARFTRESPTQMHADIAADMNRGEGFMGKRDWIARDVMNVERVRQQRKAPPVSIQEIDLSAGIEQQLPLHQMSEDIGQAISAEMAPLVAESVGRRTGARVLFEDSMEGPMSPGALVSDGTRFVITGTEEQVRRATEEVSILTGRVVGDLDEGLRRELDELILSADDALMQIDEEAWAANRARYEHASKFDPAYRYQTGPRGRGWRGAMAFDKRRRGTLYINANADMTTVVHETFHSWAQWLQPSAKRALQKAYKDSPKYKRMAKPSRPTGAKLARQAEEWASEQFEAYVASGLSTDPSLTLNHVFNAYADWGRRTGNIPNARINAIHPKLQELFDKVTPEVHGKSMAVFDPNQFRIMESFRVALLRAEDEAYSAHYFRRGKTLLERSLNHPFLGLYPLSYMYGKVLPELARFLFKKPFGINAPLAGAQMWDHVYDAMMLESSGNTELAQILNDNPEAVRFFQLIIPGIPNDIAANTPAWARRIVSNALQGEPTDIGGMMSDYIGYSLSATSSAEQIMDASVEAVRAGQAALGVLGGDRYESAADLKSSESLAKLQQSNRLNNPAMPYSGGVQ